MNTHLTQSFNILQSVFAFTFPKKPSASRGDYDNKMTDLPEWQKHFNPAN